MYKCAPLQALLQTAEEETVDRVKYNTVLSKGCGFVSTYPAEHVTSSSGLSLKSSLTTGCNPSGQVHVRM